MRRREAFWYLFLFLVTFAGLQLFITRFFSSFSFKHFSSFPSSDAEDDSVIFTLVPHRLHKFLTARFRNSAGLNNSAKTEISRNIAQLNEMQKIYNEDVYGPMENDTVIIVIQVHTRIMYLKYLIVSLAQVRDISMALLVFSHDFYVEELNELVQSVDFCKVMQIFYPYSIQTHPHEFPGEDPNDCSRDLKIEEAIIRKCNNALNPDLYGHYREAKFTQTKHHWWWKANRVFNQLEVTRNHTGLVVFLEEDHYVAEDFLYVLKLMEKTSKKISANCNILTLGTYLYRNIYDQDWKEVIITPWISNKHNMGMGFNRSTWTEIMKCAEFFCKYDDYNWDWSLLHISQTCLTHKLHAMVVTGPRVFHIGKCGVHNKKSKCASTTIITKILKFLKESNKYLFPSNLTLNFSTEEVLNLKKRYGGWGDHRDHMLCIRQTYITRPKV